MSLQGIANRYVGISALAVMELDEREGVGYHRPGSRHVQARLKGGETWAHSTDVEIFIGYRSTRQSSEGKHGDQRQGRSQKAIEGVGRLDCQGRGDTEVWQGDMGRG